MDGSLKLLAPALLVLRDFAGTRLEAQLLALAYDRLLPVARESRSAAQHATLVKVSRPRQIETDKNELASLRQGA